MKFLGRIAPCQEPAIQQIGPNDARATSDNADDAAFAGKWA
jgi:hypothetical protein